MAGSSIAAKHLRPSIRIFGAEPALASDTYQSFVKGERVKIDIPETIADGLRSVMPGELTFPIIKRNVEQMILVSEEEIRETVKFMLLRLKILVEPSGAVAPAVAFFKKLPPGVKRVGIVVSGGNIDFETLAAL